MCNIARYKKYFLLLCGMGTLYVTQAQTSPVAHIFPAGTVTYGNINYAGDTSRHHLLDIYLPANAKANAPLVIWVHGGAWMLNDKYADMSYMANTVKGFLDSGYALASIDYRYSTQAPFPAQIQDCNQAVEFLYNNAAKYKIDKHRFALIGFSAGGHLASLVGMSNNSTIPAFYYNGIKPRFTIKAVLDFYGPQDFISMAAAMSGSPSPGPNPMALLLGANIFDRPDLAKTASPLTYLDKSDPPFFIVQGEKDQSVPPSQAVLLNGWLNVYNIPHQLTIVPGAPHYGPMFDAESIRKDLFAFLKAHL
ncbi:MAG TPA: alpha/beta hydrolase [Chitinophagaceae bacterium]|nr:alpha/beta hydrolase [Chitinophagaceae bacterium]